MGKEKINFRDHKLDIMRAIGILLVILAHMGIPELVLNLRTFDVVMLVMISGMSYAYRPSKEYRLYMWKRIKKLVIPTYLIITLVGALSFVVCYILDRSQIYSVQDILKSYMFLDGMPYIWITKVYIMIALISPMLYKCVKEIRFNRVVILLLISLYIVYEISIYAFYGKGIIIYDEYLSYIIPYSLIIIVGMRIVSNERFLKDISITCLIMFILIQTIGVHKGIGFSPNDFKYPATYYFLIYGLLVSLTIYMYVPNKQIYILSWISKNSFSIYLVHIIVLMGVNTVFGAISMELYNNWFLKYLLVMIASISICHCLNLIKNIIRRTNEKNRFIKG